MVIAVVAFVHIYIFLRYPCGNFKLKTAKVTVMNRVDVIGPLYIAAQFLFCKKHVGRYI